MGVNFCNILRHRRRLGCFAVCAAVEKMPCRIRMEFQQPPIRSPLLRPGGFSGRFVRSLYLTRQALVFVKSKTCV